MTTDPGLVSPPPRIANALHRLARFIGRAARGHGERSGIIVLPAGSRPKHFVGALRNEDFGGQLLIDRSWRNLRIERCRFTGAQLANVDLRGSIISGSSFRGATFRHVDLRGARITNTYFTGVDLSCADLRGADLEFAHGLTEPQLRRARVDEHTVLPAHLGIRRQALMVRGAAAR